jgi:hypothetical protein
VFEVIWWAFAIVAVVGTFFVSILKKVRMGHLLWTIANAGLIICNTYVRAWPMVALFGAYLVLSTWGLYRWNRSS